MMGSDDHSGCNTGLSLGLVAFDDTSYYYNSQTGLDHHPNHGLRSSNSNVDGFVLLPSLRFDHVIPPLSLAGPAGTANILAAAVVSTSFMSDHSNPDPPTPIAVTVAGDDHHDNPHRPHTQIASNISPGTSSHSNNNNKRYSSTSAGQEEKEFGGEEEVDCNNKVLMVSSRGISDEDEEASPRKKLRLTKEQSAVLEDSFKEQSTLNLSQKQALATKLNLRPRQVEVWFQNRRARTKLKQTETDCEFLKKCCETLTEENKRLHKEIQELRSLKLAASSDYPHYMQMPAATLSICPSCAGNSANYSATTSSTSTHADTSGPRMMSAFPGLNNGSDTTTQPPPPGLSLNITRSSAGC